MQPPSDRRLRAHPALNCQNSTSRHPTTHRITVCVRNTLRLWRREALVGPRYLAAVLNFGHERLCPYLIETVYALWITKA
jgi:hypothetical protein